MPAAVVLYEDSRGASRRDGFGPHRLALACVADDTGADRWSLRDELVDNVRKGRDEVLKTCREQGDALSASALRVVAVLDDDRVREGLRLLGSRSEPPHRRHCGLAPVIALCRPGE